MEKQHKHRTLDQLNKKLRFNLWLQILIIALAVLLFVLIPITKRYELFAIIVLVLVVRFWIAQWRKKLKAEIRQKTELKK